jgi:hypothetical protein
VNRPPWQRWLPWAALPLLAVPALWPYTQGWPATADGWLHLVRLAVLDQHVVRGVLFPRWTPELVLGYGYPVFNFYGPTTFFLAELLHLLGLGYYQALMGCFALMVIAGGYGMYVWASDVLGEEAQPWAALAAAVAYMYAPYLLTNVFVRGAIGEVGAQALLPWVFVSFRRSLRGARPAAYVLSAALSLGGLAATHNITLLLLPPALLGYLAVLWWAGGRERRTLGAVAAGGLAAIGVGAFFWLPLLAERQYLANTALDIARQVLPAHAWTWRNFLDVSLWFRYTSQGPFQLGLVQVGLAIAGFVLARRRDAEWVYLLALAVAAGLFVGAWAVPLWLSSDLLLVAQFPWRLLGLMSPPLALLAGGCVSGWPRACWPQGKAWAAVALIVLIVWTQRPRLPPTSLTPPDNAALSLAAAAQFEAQTGALGTSSAREFFPRWVEDMALDAADAELNAGALTQVVLEQAGPYERVLTVKATAATPLRFTDFYYPGWQAQLADGTPLATYASTRMGLLTVEVPAGEQRLRVYWRETPWVRTGTGISVLTLATLAVFAATRPTRRWQAVWPAALLVAGGCAALRPLPTPTLVTTPTAPGVGDGLQLLGFRIEQTQSGYVELYPYWQISTQPPRLRAHWQLTTPAGEVVSETISEPYFGASRSDRWPAGTVVDDAYRLALPPGLPAGDYGLTLRLSLFDDEAAAAPSPVGNVRLAAVTAYRSPAPAEASGARFGEIIALAGHTLTVNGRATAASATPLVVRPNDLLEYRLDWQALDPVGTNYHSLLHFVGAPQTTLIQRDQVAGSWFRAPELWDRFHTQPETYRIVIPADAAGGVYWPNLGLYDFDRLTRLPVTEAGGQLLGNTLALPPVKVLPSAAKPPHALSARFEDLATLLGYDLQAPPEGLRPGSSLTLTAYYLSEQATGRDLTRFIHLANDEGALAAQADSQPQQGLNPTWAWVPGEVIVDRIVLTVAPEAVPGPYKLRLGLYDPAAGGARLTVTSAGGQVLEDGSVMVAEVEVGP